MTSQSYKIKITSILFLWFITDDSDSFFYYNSELNNFIKFKFIILFLFLPVET